MVGPPGIGKTHFVYNLSYALDVDERIFNLGGSADTLKFTGTASQWGNSSPSAITKFIGASKYANSLVILEEIYKIGNVGNSSGETVHNALLTLTERTSSYKYEDSYIGTPTIDASNLLYFATANSLDSINEILKSRFQIFQVGHVSEDDKKNMINSIYKKTIF